MAHVEGQSRYQTTLFPEVLDEVVGHDDPVRVIDAFVDSLDLTELKFSKVAAEEMGRPPYAPGDLLKLYVYGYLHRIRASRRLEAEASRNVQVMWLLNRLTRSFKTIADFRKDHAKGIVGVCRAFIVLCREQSLFGAELLAIDGSKIAAVASREQVLTPQRIEKMNAAIERKIARISGLDGRGGSGGAASGRRGGRCGGGDRRAAGAKGSAAGPGRGAGIEWAEATGGDRAGGKTDADAAWPCGRLQRTDRVDAEHKLIVAFELTNEGNDLQQLHPMAVQGKEAVGADQVSVVADTGYSNGEHGARCEKDGITAIVPRPETVNPRGEQYFSRDKFSYDEENDSWRCPAGETLSLYKTSHTQKKKEYIPARRAVVARSSRNAPTRPDGSSYAIFTRMRARRCTAGRSPIRLG